VRNRCGPAAVIGDESLNATGTACAGREGEASRTIREPEDLGKWEINKAFEGRKKMKILSAHMFFLTSGKNHGRKYEVTFSAVLFRCSGKVETFCEAVGRP